ncbi:MAG: PHP-associated domain-containing protein [Halodesulfurarchaeum sp.]
MERTNVDLHVKILDREVAERAKARGLDVLVYAPHFTRYPEARERAARFTDDDLLVVPAREIFTGSVRDRKHLLALDLSEPVPDFITLEGAMTELRRQDATVLVPHPAFMTVSLDERDVFRYADQIHGVEVYNPKHLERHNERAERIARAGEFDMFGSSYAHLRATVGEVWTAFDRGIETEAELISAITEGVGRRVLRRRGPTHHVRRAAEFAHLGWENSWQKIDRVLLSGIEPTHPHHIAYGGRFDDVSVY